MSQEICFSGLDKEFTSWEKADIAVLPIPYDITSTWIKGADKGPSAIIKASPYLEFYDTETDSEVYRRGIYTHPPLVIDLPPEAMVARVAKKVGELARAGKFVVALGGEHSVTVGAVKAYQGIAGGLSVLQLDAHSDLRDEYEGSRYNHACVGARIREICHLVQAGVRSMSVEEKDRLPKEDVFLAEKIVDDRTWISRTVGRLKKNVYVTIDLDVFDPSVMPSTGTPEPGGLGWYEVLKLLKTVSDERNVIGFDCVELCPDERNKAPDFMAAKLVYKFLSYIFISRN